MSVVGTEGYDLTRRRSRFLLEDRLEARGSATMGDGRGGVPLLEEHAPDLLVLDLGLPLLNGLNILRKIRDRGFSGQVVIRSVRKDDAYVSEVSDWGVLGYVLKGGQRT